MEARRVLRCRLARTHGLDDEVLTGHKGPFYYRSPQQELSSVMKVSHNTVHIITLKRATDPPGPSGTGKRTPQLELEEVVLYCEYPYANRVPGESLKGHKKELTIDMA